MKNVKRFVSLLVCLCMLLSLTTVSFAEENSYTYLGDLYTVTSANSANTYAFTDAEARTDNISLHMVHTSGTSDAITFAIPASAKTSMHFLAWGGYGYAHFKFYAKGTLPESAALQVAWSNGMVNATKTITDWSAGGITVGEADENGWRSVDIVIECKPSNAGSYGGWANVKFNVTGAADFYMDDVNFDYEIYNSAGAYQSSVTGLLDDYDPSFENVLYPETWEDIAYTDAEKASLGVENGVFSVSGSNSENWGAFRADNAYESDVSMHLVHTSTNSDALNFHIGKGTAALQGLSNWATNMSATVKFYAKGHIPDTASYTLGISNGHLKCTAVDRSAWTVGEEDENGWKPVTINISGNYDSGWYGGYVVSYITISSQADMYIDNVTFNWTQNGQSSEILSKYSVDGSFEDAARDTVYSAERSTYIMNHGEYTVSGATDDNWYSFTDDAYKTGSKALHLVHKYDNTDTLTFTVNHDLKLFNVGGWATNMTAAFKFYAKGTLPASGNLRLSYTNGNLTYNVDRAAWTVGEEDENGWKLVTVSGTGTFGSLYGGLINVTMNITGQCDMYIDDISLDWTQAGTSAELLSKYGYDTSFENVKYEVSNVAAEKENIRSLTYDWAADSIQLSWKNPANDNITGFKVLKDGVDVTGDAEFDTSSMAVNKFDISGLAASSAHDFTVVMTVDGAEKTADITARTRNDRNWVRFTHDNYPFGDGTWSPYWSKTSDGTGFDTNIGFYIDESEKYEGQSSLKMVSNNQSKPNQYMYMTHGLDGLDTTSKYTFSFMGKAVDAGKMRMAVNFGSANTYTTGINIGESGYLMNDSWREYSVEIDAPTAASAPLRLEINGACDAFYIDNMKLVKSGDTVNLLNNGGFEYEVTSVSVDENTKTVSWTTGETPWDGYEIYKADPRTGELVRVASYALADLADGNKFTDSAQSANSMYVVKTQFDVLGSNWSSEGVATADWDVTYPVFDTVTFGGDFSKFGEDAEIVGEANAIDAEGGNYMASVGVNNVSASEALKLKFFTALYKNGALVDIVTLDSSVNAGAAPTAFKGVINVPAKAEGETYTLKTFVWNSVTLAPVTGVGSISSAQ